MSNIWTFLTNNNIISNNSAHSRPVYTRETHWRTLSEPCLPRPMSPNWPKPHPSLWVAASLLSHGKVSHSSQALPSIDPRHKDHKTYQRTKEAESVPECQVRVQMNLRKSITEHSTPSLAHTDRLSTSSRSTPANTMSWLIILLLQCLSQHAGLTAQPCPAWNLNVKPLKHQLLCSMV